MIRAVLFDYGGVLTSSGAAGSLEKLIADHVGINAADVYVEDLIDPLRRGLTTTDDFFHSLAARFPFGNPFSEKSFYDERTMLTSRSEEVYNLAASLRSKGIKTGILSNVIRIGADKSREFGLYEGFNPVILSSEVKMAKPDPEIYQLAIDKFGVKPQEIIFVDDQEKCWAPAEKIGMKIVKALSPSQIVREVKTLIQQENEIQL